MAELSQEAVAQEEQTQQSTQVATDPEAGMTTDEKLLRRLTEIKDVLDNINKEQVDPSLYTDILETFADEKKEELQAIVEEVNDPLGEKTITRKTCFGYGIDLLVWQEVWVKDGVITKYGSFYTRGAAPTSVVGIGGGNQINSRIPLPQDVEFDALFYCEGIFHARPKAGQSNLDGISGSLDHYIFSFGNGNQGGLGTGSTGNVWATYYIKTQMESRVKNILNASEIANNISIVALLENRSLWGTGRNVCGELGQGNTTQVNTWTKITENVDSVFTGSPALFVVKGDVLYACGASERGSLGSGGTTNRTSLTQIKTSVDVKSIKSMRFYNGSAYTAFTFMRSGNRVYGAGGNGSNQIISADTSDKSVFTEITDNMGGSIECNDGTDFAIGLYTTILLTPNGENTDLWVAGTGEDGYGDSAAEGTNNKRRKITTLEGTGWKCECPIKGHGSGTMRSSFFIYNEKRREIKVFGYSGVNLGSGATSEVLRGIATLSLPKANEQFEVSFGWGKASGFYLCLIADGTLYITGGEKSGMISGTYTQLNPVVSAM